MKRSDLHVHTCFCDGKNTPEEMVEAALERGMTELGLLVHAYTFFDERYCVRKERVPRFQEEMRRLKEKYQGKLRLLCGVEQDLYSDADTDGFDYVIGSVHYVKCGDDYLPVDESPALWQQTVQTCFGGDPYAFADAYFQAVAQVAEAVRPDLIGHFDLIAKFNESEGFFSEEDSRYVASWKRALDRLLPFGIPFESNFGAITRGYRSQPYPRQDMAAYIRSHGGVLIPTGDCHCSEHLGISCDLAPKFASFP